MVRDNVKQLSRFGMLVTALSVFAFCSQSKRQNEAGRNVVGIESQSHLLIGPLMSGDLLFRVGRGWRAGAVSAASGQSLTHVGIVDQNTNGQLYVIHASPPEPGKMGMVRRELLGSYASRSDAIALQAIRLTLPKKVIRGMLREARIQVYHQTPFDDSFDLESQNRIYCTELVWRALAASGLSLKPKQTIINIPLIKREFMTPSDLVVMLKGKSRLLWKDEVK